jgi:hypothetical protein
LGAHAWVNAITCQKQLPNVLTATLIVLIENSLTLMHMPRLLTNSEFREQCLERVTDASIVEFVRKDTTRPSWLAARSTMALPFVVSHTTRHVGAAIPAR